MESSIRRQEQAQEVKPETEVIIVDIDGTLADCQHRRHHIEKTPKDWDSFLSPKNIAKDSVIKPIARLVTMLQEHHRVIYVSGRKEAVRDCTVTWLRKHGLWFYPFELFMRPTGDRRPDFEVKRDILHEVIYPLNYKPILVLDDRSSVVEMWRSEKLTCLQVADGDF